MPLVGLNVGALGATITVKLAALVPVPAAFVTETVPVVAPAGTVVEICASLSTVNVADVPLNFTAVAPVKCVPVSVTAAPTMPLVGANVGALGVRMTGKLDARDAGDAALVTEINPVVAPAGTVAVICVLLSTTNVAVVPLNFT